MMPDLPLSSWLLVILAAVCVGISKSGFSGMSLIHVVVMAKVFGGKHSTGVVLPMLCIGDVCAVLLFKRHAVWRHVWRTLPVACGGVIIGTGLMKLLPEQAYPPIIGWIVFVLVVLQLWRLAQPARFEAVPHSWTFAAVMGLLAGITTMMANAAGPVMGLYLISVGLPKYQFAGTSAWFFLIINLYKIPFSVSLGLITGSSLLFNLLLAPAIVGGLFFGRWLLPHVSQKLFDTLILIFAAVVALWRMGLFDLAVRLIP